MSEKTNNEPLAQREKKTFLNKNLSFSGKGWLKNGNPTGDPTKALRCNARSKRTGEPCRQPAMTNGKCRLHGGLSTGPKTSVGLMHSRRANWKHGEYSRERKEELQALRQGLKTILNPQALFDLSPAEIRMHNAVLARLMGKMQSGF